MKGYQHQNTQRGQEEKRSKHCDDNMPHITMQQTSTQTTIWACKLQTIHTSQNEFGERKPNITQANMTHQNLNISKTMKPSPLSKMITTLTTNHGT
jgi:hypothetical protein